MAEWIESLLLGFVQGVTEFLPISSDGHLVLTQQIFARLTGKERSADENLFFDVMLHLGTLAAIVIYYRAVVRTGVKGLLGSEDVPPSYRRGAVIRVGFLAAVATSPLVPLALFFLKWIKRAFDSMAATGVGFLITAAVLLLTAFLQRRGEGGKGPAETTWLDALLIGLAQMFAPLPGVSRSGLTVAAALGLGFSRAWAVGFSLLIAVPAILGAVVKELKDVNPAVMTADRVSQTVAATVLAGLVGYGAIIWLVKIVRSGRMWYFSVYLILLGLAILAVVTAGGGPNNGSRTNAARGTLRGGGDHPVAAAHDLAARPGRPLDRPDASGRGAVADLAGEQDLRGELPARLVLD
ncbi:MAG: undecaprenyl-diphosphate phosphatase [Isosphaeraceae bacterium]